MARRALARLALFGALFPAAAALARLALFGALLPAGAQSLVLSDAGHAGPTNPINKTIFAFIHIPKCAGSSFLECIGVSLGTSGAGRESLHRIYPHEGNSWNSKGCGDSPRNKNGGGHCSVGEIHDCFLTGHAELTRGIRYDSSQTTMRYFTILRHPVARVLSEYYWWRHDPGGSWGHWPHELHATSGNLLAWVRSPYNVAHNRMVKQLTATGAQLPEGMRGRTDCMTFDMPYYQRYWMGKYNLSWKQGLEARINTDTSLLDEAERNTWFAATQEDLKSSAMRLLELFGGGQLEKGQKNMIQNCSIHAHVSSHTGGHAYDKSLVPDDVIKEIEERNKLDMAIYLLHKTAEEPVRARKLSQPQAAGTPRAVHQRNKIARRPRFSTAGGVRNVTEIREQFKKALRARWAAGAGAGRARNLRLLLEDPEGQDAGRPWTWEEVLQGDLD